LPKNTATKDAQRARNRHAAQGNPALPQGIEGVKMSKKHYNLMRNLLVALPCLAAAFFVHGLATTSHARSSRRASERTFQGAASSTLKTSSLESHEGVTISARPWMDPTQYKEKFPKKSPFAAGVLAVQVSIRNDSDQSVKVGLERIRLSFNLDQENRQELEPMKAAEVADAVLRPGGKDPTARRRLPLPITTGGNKSKDFTELQNQAQNAAIPTSVVAAHSTVQGLLYFDMQGQFDLLHTAHLYVPDVAVMGKTEGLTYFEIDLSR
jgi:hypothetical protein